MTKNDLKTKEQGRSMIEMIGVLAIIGVLSVGALSGYRMAMTRYRANEVIDYAMRVGEAAVHHGTTQKTGSIPYYGDDKCKEYVNGEEAPLDMNCFIANGNSSNVPVAFFVFAGENYSTELGAAINKQVGGCSNGTRFPCSAMTNSCPYTGTITNGQPCVRFFFKK